mmetsp:Transcript_18879/g.44355  ORF Transcript_18879/g.44355 Transcript_18879/m.44355 type:complete len:213 (+) Transcript_18879:1842-2480(+)
MSTVSPSRCGGPPCPMQRPTLWNSAKAHPPAWSVSCVRRQWRRAALLLNCELGDCGQAALGANVIPHRFGASLNVVANPTRPSPAGILLCRPRHRARCCLRWPLQSKMRRRRQQQVLKALLVGAACLCCSHSLCKSRIADSSRSTRQLVRRLHTHQPRNGLASRNPNQRLSWLLSVCRPLGQHQCRAATCSRQQWLSTLRFSTPAPRPPQQD